MAINQSVGVRLAMKQFFFDRAKVITAIEKANKRNLSYHAGLVRKIARRSLKRVSKAAAKRAAKQAKEARRRGERFRDPTVSAPGQPPKIHTPGDMNLKKILYAYIPATQTAIVGPMRFNTKFNVCQVLEHGGRTKVFAGRGRKRRVVRTFNIEARPFIAPAERQARPYMEQRWANSLVAR